MANTELTTEQSDKRREGTLSTVVYGEIKKQIFANHLRPGAKIMYTDVSNLLQVSRTPIREALERLCEEGFVVRYPNRGYFVAQIGESEVEDLFGLREALEIHALQQVSKTGLSDEQMAKIRLMNDRYGKLARDNRTRFRMMADRDFHLTLASAAGNDALLRALDMAFERLILKINIEGYSPVYGESGLVEHGKIVEALSAGRFDEAIDLLRKHIQSSGGRVLDHLRANQPPEFYSYPEFLSESADAD